LSFPKTSCSNCEAPSRYRRLIADIARTGDDTRADDPRHLHFVEAILNAAPRNPRDHIEGREVSRLAPPLPLRASAPHAPMNFAARPPWGAPSEKAIAPSHASAVLPNGSGGACELECRAGRDYPRRRRICVHHESFPSIMRTEQYDSEPRLASWRPTAKSVTSTLKNSSDP